MSEPRLPRVGQRVRVTEVERLEREAIASADVLNTTNEDLIRTEEQLATARQEKQLLAARVSKQRKELQSVNRAIRVLKLENELMRHRYAPQAVEEASKTFERLVTKETLDNMCADESTVCARSRDDVARRLNILERKVKLLHPQRDFTVALIVAQEELAKLVPGGAVRDISRATVIELQRHLLVLDALEYLDRLPVDPNAPK